MARADGQWVDTSYRGRVKDFLTERFDYLKDNIRNNRRGTAYAAAAIGSGIAGYALTGVPLLGVMCSSISTGICAIHAESQIFTTIEERIDKLCGID